MSNIPGTRSIRIGYHRISDDSISSSFWAPGPQRTRFIAELLADPDIDRAWYRLPDPFAVDSLGEPQSLKDVQPCCDGTGWTGDPHERCVNHYEPLDAIWFS